MTKAAAVPWGVIQVRRTIRRRTRSWRESGDVGAAGKVWLKVSGLRHFRQLQLVATVVRDRFPLNNNFIMKEERAVEFGVFLGGIFLILFCFSCCFLVWGFLFWFLFGFSSTAPDSSGNSRITSQGLWDPLCEVSLPKAMSAGYHVSPPRAAGTLETQAGPWFWE